MRDRPGNEIAVVEPVDTGDRYAALNAATGRLDAEWILFVGGGRTERGRAGSVAAKEAVALARVAVEEAPELDAIALPDLDVLVRRAAFEDAGGFAEGIRAGGELDLLLRLRALGRRVGGELPAPPPAAAGWLGRRFRGRSPNGFSGGLLTRLFADNRIAERRRPPPRAPEPAVVVLTDAYPARSETFIYREVEALRALGWSVRVEASARPDRVERSAAGAGRLDYLEDDPPLGGITALAWLTVRHPLRCFADLRSRRRWATDEEPWPLRSLAPAARRLTRGGERHLHVHFAGGAALHALRLSRILGITYSVVGHGYDVFARPRNLREKLSAAAFIVAPCEYTAEHLRRRLPLGRRGDVHVIVMGVDPEQFARATPHGGSGTVVAVGRLVEKKGFADLIAAVALLAGTPAAEPGSPAAGVDTARSQGQTAHTPRLIIAGDGPLRAELERAIERSGLHERAAIASAWGAGSIRALLEDADLLAMPSVIAADGDRDAMPVVVKEALAMEVPVVATEEVGLPELVHPEWGSLVPPRDPEALAAAIAELLALPRERRAEMGAAGRAHVRANCDIHTETAKLAALIEGILRASASDA